MADLTMQILGEEEIFRRAIFRWKSVKFTYTRFDGSIAGPFDHLVLDRGDSVGMLLHDVPANEVVFVEQARVATSGWILELPAGRVEPNEDPAATAGREAAEETGAAPATVQRISSFYLSPGGCSERLHLFYCPFSDGLTVHEYAGLAQDSEDIRVHRIPLPRALEMIETGEIADAKTIIGLYWLARQA